MVASNSDLMSWKICSSSGLFKGSHVLNPGAKAKYLQKLVNTVKNEEISKNEILV